MPDICCQGEVGKVSSDWWTEAVVIAWVPHSGPTLSIHCHLHFLGRLLILRRVPPSATVQQTWFAPLVSPLGVLQDSVIKPLAFQFEGVIQVAFGNG